MKEIVLNQDKVVKVDDEDYPAVILFSWTAIKRSLSDTWVAVHQIGKEKVLMHRFVMNAPTSLEVDHIDGDGLNNQKSNLRFATRLQNAANRKLGKNNKSGAKGVSWNEEKQKWRTQVYYKGVSVFSRYFSDKEEAIRAYNKKAKEVFGEFARVN